MSSRTVISKIGIAVLALRIKANEELAVGREAVIMAGLRVASRPQFEIRYEVLFPYLDALVRESAEKVPEPEPDLEGPF